MSDAPSASAFEALVGSTFRVVGPWDPDLDPGTTAASPGDPDSPPGAAPDVALTLVEVARLGDGGPFEQFRATFTGPGSAPLDQGTFVLDPPPAGLDAIFLVPNADQGDERVYSASISVRRPSTESVGP